MSKHGLMKHFSRKDLFKALKNGGGEAPTRGESTAGAIALGATRYGGHAGLALWSTTMERGWFGIDAFRPDTFVGALAGFGWAYCKLFKKKGILLKTSKAAGAASGHAFITRLVLKAKTILVHGPDGTWSFKSG